MRHQNRVKTLGRPKDQREAMVRALATALFMHGEIQTTVTRAKVLKAYAEKIITFAKQGDLHSRRMAARMIYDQAIPGAEEMPAPEDGKKALEATVLRKLFSEIGPKFKDKNGGYTRIYRIGNRRGDNAEMALIQLV
jgi:large subunit ribosomal protein L17